MTRTEVRRHSLALESCLFAGRLFAKWRRHPGVPVQALLFPTVLLITYNLLVGKSMAMMTGTDNLDALVPMCAVAGGMFGAIGAAIAIPNERSGGLLTRFWTLPVHRASALTGRLLAEATRTLVGSVVVTAVGVALGLRFTGGWLAVVPYLLVPVFIAVAFATFVTALALRSEGTALFMWLGTSSIGLVFASPGLAPVEMFPGWLRPFVEHQPMASVIETMRGLSTGELTAAPALVTAGWVVAIMAVFLPLAVRGYRAAARGE
ncbi:ABC transporter [Mycobacterium sp. 852013-51886_SCH5428379]|uniref:ABC transporter permease n=1 Tax=Mycobacterium sp. 852013-51886_SCH5428379 TaxID=1834111 RepID=UPI000801319D|nr:ABC transporter permease [Mycobacterium sp. 852013-51886_SCH5428379]OBB59709.1 ABC transporter [Mycobacterium sp. 852013-51886_SCH5428379]